MAPLLGQASDITITLVPSGETSRMSTSVGKA
jgi:hypothetical protein